MTVVGLAHDNPASLRGGEHFFRASTEHTTLFEILP